MFTAVQSGHLAGIHIVNQKVPALRANRMNRSWWEVIPKGEDAIFFSTCKPRRRLPVIAFRDQIKSDRRGSTRPFEKRQSHSAS